jgi:hypothetical protein
MLRRPRNDLQTFASFNMHVNPAAPEGHAPGVTCAVAS